MTNPWYLFGMGSSQLPPWLRGAVPGILPLLQPVAHALIDADEDVSKALASLTAEQLRAGLASPEHAEFAAKLRRTTGS